MGSVWPAACGLWQQWRPKIRTSEREMERECSLTQQVAAAGRRAAALPLVILPVSTGEEEKLFLRSSPEFHYLPGAGSAAPVLAGQLSGWLWWLARPCLLAAAAPLGSAQPSSAWLGSARLRSPACLLACPSLRPLVASGRWLDCGKCSGSFAVTLTVPPPPTPPATGPSATAMNSDPFPLVLALVLNTDVVVVVSPPADWHYRLSSAQQQEPLRQQDAAASHQEQQQRQEQVREQELSRCNQTNCLRKVSRSPLN